MMFRWINKQGCKSFEIDVTIKKSMTEYNNLINCAGLPLILTQQSMGKTYGKSGLLSSFTILKLLMMLLKFNIC